MTVFSSRFSVPRVPLFDRSPEAQPTTARPFQVTAQWFLGLFLLALPFTLASFEGASVSLRFYIAFLISGLIAFGGLLVVMTVRPMLKSARVRATHGDFNAA